MRVVVFGTNEMAKLAWHALNTDSQHEVVAFTVHADFLERTEYCALPVVAFEAIEARFEPGRFGIAVPVGCTDMNGIRLTIHREAKRKGYEVVSYVSSRALVQPDLVIGEGAMIFEGAIVQPFTRLGAGVIVRSGAMISHDVVVEDFCFIASRASVGGCATIGERCFLGINSTVLPKVQMAPRSLLAAGAVLVNATEEDGVYVGVPAKRHFRTAEQVTAGRTAHAS